MNRRHWLALAAASLASCRRDAPAAPEQRPWHPLAKSWTGVEGGEVTLENDILRLGWAETLTAARWTGEVPAPPFEIEFEARRIDGSDFFCALTFPARGDENATLILGGWGGSMIGISSIDGKDASENETTTYGKFENGTWYRVRLECTPETLRAWLDGEKVIDVATADKVLSLRPGPISVCLPFGFATWQSTGEIKNLRWRPI